MARCLTRKCQICLTTTGEEKNVSLGCSLRIDLEKNLNCQFLVTVTTLVICSPCCSLIELWNVFTSKARNNLVTVCQKSTQNGGGTRLRNNVLSLSRTLTQVLQSTGVSQTSHTERNKTSRLENGTTDKNPVISNSLVSPNIKACSIVLDHREVSNYFQQKKQLHSAPSEDLSSDEQSAVPKVTTRGDSQVNSQNDVCSLDMECEFDTELPASRIVPRSCSPASSTGNNEELPEADIAYSPTSPGASSSVSDGQDLVSQGAQDKTASTEITAPQLLSSKVQTLAQRTSSRNKYKCYICNESLNSKAAIELHIKNHTKHSKKTSTLKKCAFCSKQFSKRKNLVDHIYSHLKKGNPYCHSCGMIFKSDDDLKLHFMSLKCKNFNPLQCCICSKEFIAERLVRSHAQLAHKIKIGSQQTKQGEHITYYKRKYSLPQPRTSKEVATVRSQLFKKDSFKCKICGYVFSKKINLNSHLLSIHKLDPKKRMSSKHIRTAIASEFQDGDDSQEGKYTNTKFSCNECKIHFLNLFELRLHMLKLHNIVVPKYICNYCDATFQHYLQFEKHLKVDHASRNYMCELCGASFFLKNDLALHLQLHKNKIFSCQICNELFSQSKLLTLHMFLKHISPKLPHTAWEIRPSSNSSVPAASSISNDINDTTEVMLLECEFCSESFPSEHELEKHNLNEHFKNIETSNEAVNDIDKEMMASLNKNDNDGGPICKSFPCFSCNEEFSLLFHLRQHIHKFHNAAKQMRCKLCNKSQPDIKSHIRHFKTNHTVMPGYAVRCPSCNMCMKNREYLAKHFGGILPPEINFIDCCVPSSEAEKYEQKCKKDSYKCQFCENVYTSYNGWLKHIKDYHPEEWKHLCKFCNKKFVEFCAAKRHEKTCGKGKFICPYCEVCISNKGDYKQHVLKMHDGKSAFYCKECDMEFPTNGSLLSHKSKHTSLQFTVYKASNCNESQSPEVSSLPTQQEGDTTDTFTCPTCNGHFPTLDKVKIHLITVHQKLTCFCCGICGSPYNQIDSLRKHMEYAHFNKKKREGPKKKPTNKSVVSVVKPTAASTKIYHCNKCGKQYLTCGLYLKHFYSCKIKTPCAGCGKTSVEGKWAEHEAECTLIPRPYKCMKCPRKFSHTLFLKRHKWNHVLCWADRMKCDHCSLSFDSLMNVLKHYRLRHMNQLPLPLFCKHCDYNCDSKTELKLHFHQHNQQMVHCNGCHRDVIHSQFKKAHVFCCNSTTCSMCGEEFENTANLFLHVQEDHQIGNYSCLLCLNSFPSESNLQQHVTHNHGQVPFQCDICKVNISYKENLRTHLKIHMQNNNRCKICGLHLLSAMRVYKHILKNHKDSIPDDVMELLSQISTPSL